MIALLDTHVLLWLALDSERLSKPAQRLVQRALRRGGLGIASISLWEVAQLAARGRLNVQGTLSNWLSELLSRTGVAVMNLTPSIAELSTAFGPDFPRDPADRIIAATARANAAPLVTADERIRSDVLVKTVW